MTLILVSLIWMAIFIFAIILVLNYATYQWENQRVNDLASKIKPAETDILHKSLVDREFTSFDLRSMNKSAPARAAQNLYDKTIILISNQNYPTWVNELIKHFNELRQDAWKKIKQTIDYLIHLAKPADHSDMVVEDPNETASQDSKQEEIENLVDKVKDHNQSTKAMTLAQPTEEEDVFQNSTQTKSNSTESANEFATIGLAASMEARDEKDMSLFEKLETRILEKLKQTSMNNYDIWLELGELYAKYGEREKATEVFALVLKHTTNDYQKEIARNRLIGL